MNHETARAPEQIRRPRRRRRKRRRNPLPLILTAALILFSLWKLTSELTDKIRSRQQLDQMAAQVVQENTQSTEAAISESPRLRRQSPWNLPPSRWILKNCGFIIPM